MAQHVIEMKEITKKFGDFVANDHINLNVRKGEIHALLGENGAGKSTLMNMLAGLLEPTSGTLSLTVSLLLLTLLPNLLDWVLEWYTSTLC